MARVRPLTRGPEAGESGFGVGIDEHIRKLDIHKNLPRGATVCPAFFLLVSGFSSAPVLLSSPARQGHKGGTPCHFDPAARVTSADSHLAHYAPGGS